MSCEQYDGVAPVPGPGPGSAAEVSPLVVATASTSNSSFAPLVKSAAVEAELLVSPLAAAAAGEGGDGRAAFADVRPDEMNVRRGMPGRVASAGLLGALPAELAGTASATPESSGGGWSAEARLLRQPGARAAAATNDAVDKLLAVLEAESMARARIGVGGEAGRGSRSGNLRRSEAEGDDEAGGSGGESRSDAWAAVSSVEWAARPGGGHSSRRSRILGHARGEYAFVNEGCIDEDRFHIDLTSIAWSDYDSLYRVFWNRCLGEGSYGQVYLAQHRPSKSLCVVKTIRREKEDTLKLKKEIKMLLLLAGHPAIVQLLDMVEHPRRKLKMLVFEYVAYADPRELMLHMNLDQLRYFMYHALLGINYAHSQGIIHRDVKEANVLFDPVEWKVRLIDWGFGTFYFPHVKHSRWPGTRYYKSPDLFLHYRYYDYSVDMWAFACMMGAAVFRRLPMFRCKTDHNSAQLIAIGMLLGSDDYAAYLDAYDFPLGGKFDAQFMAASVPRKRVKWRRLVNESNIDVAHPDALDLLDRLLVWDHEVRLTAYEALAHRFFDPVRRPDLESSAQLPRHPPFRTALVGGRAAEAASLGYA
ncbi:CMGC/CK2 protein kinase [Thecamonas trahens ATCC 50062]|uniref:non-specific serine/threonine protein kinase n=1 Tax=Thecamonas trahens ATCC 50062 TaxID=461836 RepID=A0A0L0DQT7_THETB|nr:CMGC/CK2 protein kinase [Thecamonas trahens ATCC 50062]KNC53798.1 CMGC/CK2 protein kinase [Thecamonas trahens ATCC 50062]|eukprot:XP_013754358.1 CMGC/CK2 protein kinase [Thecamonas trahens ATCC 50062]